MRRILALLLLLTALPAWSAQVVVVRAKPVKHHRHWWPFRKVYRAFPPSHEALVAQNRLADQLGLNRFFDDSDLQEAVERGDMVSIQETQYVQLAHTLPLERRLVRPWVNDFLQDLGQKFYEQYHQPIQVNSAVRTYLVQVKLRRWNRNAAPVEGESASSHMTGATVDLQRRGLKKGQIRFMEMQLLLYYARGWIIEEEELAQPCFHSMVSGTFGKVDVPTTTSTIDEEIPVVE